MKLDCVISFTYYHSFDGVETSVAVPSVYISFDQRVGKSTWFGIPKKEHIPCLNSFISLLNSSLRLL